METNYKQTISNATREALRKPLPPEAIKQHPTKKFLSTIKAIYVIERLNDVFGVGGWTTNSTFVEKVDKMVIIKTILSIPNYEITLEAFGGNDNADLGDAYKGAVTDGITKIGSYLEIGIDVFKGLATNYKEDNSPTPTTQQGDKLLFHLLVGELNEVKSKDKLDKVLLSIKEHKNKLSQNEIDSLRDLYDEKKIGLQ